MSPVSQKQVLQFILSFDERQGAPPSLQTISRRFNVDRDVVCEHISALAAAGKLRLGHGQVDSPYEIVIRHRIILGEGLPVIEGDQIRLESAGKPVHLRPVQLPRAGTFKLVLEQLG